MNPYSDWETAEEIERRLASKGLKATPDQWERWRGWGFLSPARQVGQGRGMGSVTRYPPGTAERTAKVARLFAQKERAAFVGWELWWSGDDDVPEHWWRPVVVGSAKSWRTGLRMLDRALTESEADDSDNTIFDELPQTVRGQAPFKQALKTLTEPEIPTAFSLLTSVALGIFDDTADHKVGGERGLFDIAEHALGITRSRTDAIMGVGFRFTEALPGVLTTLNRMPKLPDNSRLFEGANLRNLRSARDDARNAFAAVAAFREAVGWVYGRDAFGLGLAGWFAEKSPANMKAMLVLGLMQLRLVSNEFHSSEEIVALRQGAERLLAQSSAFKSAMEADERLKPFLNSKQLRFAFQSPKNMAIYQREIEQARLQ